MSALTIAPVPIKEFPLLPASPTTKEVEELMMLNRLYTSVENHLAGLDMSNEDDADDMRALKDAADWFHDWLDSDWLERREIDLERRDSFTEEEEETRQGEIDDFLYTLGGIPDRKALKYFKAHSDYLNILSNIADTIRDYEADEESDEE